jgi:serine/threonine protein kinase
MSVLLKGHNSSCYNMVHRVKHLDNGLTFMPVQCTGVIFSMYCYGFCRKDSYYSEKDVARIVRQMLNVASRCHLNGVVHHDMNPEVWSPSPWGIWEWHCVQDQSLQCPSNAIGPFKIYLSENNPSKCNPKLKMKTSLEVLNIICLPQEPTSVGHCNYKK